MRLDSLRHPLEGLASGCVRNSQKIDVVIERERTIKAVRLIGSVTGECYRTAGEDPSNAATSQNVAFDPYHGKVRCKGVRIRCPIALDIDGANVEVTELASQAPSAKNRYGLSLI